MDKENEENVVHLHNSVLLSGEKQWHLGICMQMDGTWRNRPEWGNPDPETLTQYIFTHKWILSVKQSIMSL